MHSHKETQGHTYKEEPSLTFVPLSSILFGLSVSVEREEEVKDPGQCQKWPLMLN